MSDRQRQQTSDELEEDFLQALFDEAAEAEGEALQKAFQAELEAGTAPRMPEELDAKYRKWIRTSKRKGKIIQFRKLLGISLKTVAILVLVLIALTSTMVVSVDAIRLPVINLFVTNEDRYSSLFFGSKREEPSMSIEDRVLSARLPEGYSLETIEQIPNGAICIRFVDDADGSLQVNVWSSEVTINYDTEDTDQISTTVNEWPAIYLQKNGHRMIWFNSDLDYFFDVQVNSLDKSKFLEYIHRLAK